MIGPSTTKLNLWHSRVQMMQRVLSLEERYFTLDVFSWAAVPTTASMCDILRASGMLLIALLAKAGQAY